MGSTHALGGVPHSARLVAGLHSREVAALAAADLLPVVLNSEAVLDYHSETIIFELNCVLDF